MRATGVRRVVRSGSSLCVRLGDMAGELGVGQGDMVRVTMGRWPADGDGEMSDMRGDERRETMGRETMRRDIMSGRGRMTDEAGVTSPMTMETVHDGRGWRLRWAVGGRRGTAGVTRLTAEALTVAVQRALDGELTAPVTLDGALPVRVEPVTDGCLGACAQVTVWQGEASWCGVVTEPVGEA